MKTPSTFQGISLLKASAAPTDNAVIYSDELDALEYDGGHVTIIIGTTAGAASDIDTIHVEESDVSGSGFADISGADFTAITTANDGAIQMASLRLQARKRYLRVGYNPGAANDADWFVLAVLQGARESSTNADSYEFEL